MAFEDVAHRLVADRIAQVGQGTHDAVIAPRAILAGHAHHQGLQLLVDAGTSQRLARLGAVTLLGTSCGARRGWCRASQLSRSLLVPSCPASGQSRPGSCAQRRSAARACDLVAQDAVFRRQIRIAQAEFLIDRSRDMTPAVASNPWVIPPQSLPLVGGEYGPYRGGMQDEERAMVGP